MSDAVEPLVTVMTPTYNRSDALTRLYKSLLKQTFEDFDWVIVDDGSTDDTEYLVGQWHHEAKISIRYAYQNNAGKHVAFNRGVNLATGYFVAQIDSDDELLPDALSKMLAAWDGIAKNDRERFVGVTGLCLDDAGGLVGTRYPKDRFVSNSIESRYRYKARGEKWGFQRRRVLLEYPFPEPVGVKNLPMGIIWSRIAQRYQTLYINEPVRIYHSDVAADQITKRHISATAPGRFMAHQEILNLHMRWFRKAPVSFLHSAVQYARTGFHIGKPAVVQAHALRFGARWLWLCALPPAWALYCLDCLAVKRGRE